MEASPPNWQSPESLKDVYLIIPPNAGLPNGAQVPLLSFAKYSLTIRRSLSTIRGNLPHPQFLLILPLGVSLSQATVAIQGTMSRLGVPGSIRGSFQGTAKTFQESSQSMPWLILAALIAIYIVLGILYESYSTHSRSYPRYRPGVGALLALMISNTEFTHYGLDRSILLIGILKENAIMMIDFLALDRERKRRRKALIESIF